MNAAIQFIEAIASMSRYLRPELQEILDVLEDGEALMHLGVTDEDQAMVEEAHEIVQGWIDAGHVTLAEAKAA